MVRSLPKPEEQRLDAYSVILHELGHALGFNGYRDSETGELPGRHLSAYDRWVETCGKHFFFNGPQARKIYGGPFPARSPTTTTSANPAAPAKTACARI